MQRLTCLLLATTAQFAAEVAGDTPSVPQWGRWDGSVENATKYDSPLNDVTLHATFQSPSGRTVDWVGFYDGDNTWRVRFMPDEVGPWSYSLRFSDDSSTSDGTFVCKETAQGGPLEALPANPIWFGRRGGGRFLMRLFHCGDRFFASNWDAGERTRFLDWAQEQGYNTLSIASCFLNRAVQGRGAEWDTPRLWPIKPTEFQEFEVILNELAARDIVLFPFAGFFGRNSNFPVTPQEQEAYVHYVIARFGAYANIVWNVAGPEPLLRKKPFLTYDEVGGLAELIERSDPFDHMITVHNATGDDVFRGESWHDFGTLQGPKTIKRETLALTLLRNHHPARPLYAQETLWPGNVVGHPRYSNDDIRRNALVALFSAAMINYGDMDGNSSSGFSASLDPQDAVASRHAIIAHAWNTFDELPWHRMAPRPDIVTGGFCLADPGQTYAVYLCESDKARVRLNPGTYSLRWISTIDPEQRVEGDDVSDMPTLIPPAGGEWIALIERRSDAIVEQDGVVAFEAEQGVGEWPVVESPTGKAIIDPGGGRMRYRLRFNQPGKYYVFLYAKQGPRGRDKENDVLLSLSGEKLFGQDGVTRPDGMRSYGDWKWARLPKGPGYHTPNAIRDGGVYFEIPSPGEYDFEIVHRSNNFAIDRIIMKRNDPEPPSE